MFLFFDLGEGLDFVLVDFLCIPVVTKDFTTDALSGIYSACGFAGDFVYNGRAS